MRHQQLRLMLLGERREDDIAQARDGQQDADQPGEVPNPKLELGMIVGRNTAAPANSADGGWLGGPCFRRFPGGIRLVRDARGIAEEKMGILIMKLR